MSNQNHLQHQNLPPTVTGPPPYSTLGAMPRHGRTMEISSKPRSPNRSEHSPPPSHPTKRNHILSEIHSEPDLRMTSTMNENLEHCHLHSMQFQNPKMLLQQITKYLPRDLIAYIISTRNCIKSPDISFACKIRNHPSSEIFGKNANITHLDQKPIKQDHLHYL